EEAPLPSKPKHPMPAFCWAWAVGALFMLLIGGLWLRGYIERYKPLPALAENAKKYADKPMSPDDPGWNAVLLVGCVGIFNGIGSWALWYWFTIKRAFTRVVWQTGIGLILTGAIFFLCTGWLISTMLTLVALSFWVQRLTKQHFDLS
ncbi:MAG TPA: hypothetical protein VHM91_15410, partial [Verrucomicrobiales bacterium]|nr:hypothetical protein [Verrucomicrobiales bacterium]